MSNCGQKIIDGCKDVTLMNTGTISTWATASDRIIDNKFKRLASEIVSIGSFLITTTMAASSSSMSLNMVKGLNALRCAFSSGFINVWMLLGSLFYAARQFGQEEQITKQLDENYGYICTCKDDVEELQKLMAVTGQQA